MLPGSGAGWALWLTLVVLVAGGALVGYKAIRGHGKPGWWRVGPADEDSAKREEETRQALHRRHQWE